MIDQPDISTIITGPTSNPALMEQIAGRALRQQEGKKDPVICLVWPWAGGTGQALSIVAAMTRRSERALRSCGFKDYRTACR